MVQPTFRFALAPHSFQEGAFTFRQSKNKWPWLPSAAASGGSHRPVTLGCTLGVFSPGVVFVTLLGPSQSQIQATSQRQTAEGHDIHHTFQITDSCGKSVWVTLCKHPVVLTEPCGRTLQPERVGKNHLFYLLWQSVKNKSISNQ